MFFFFQAEDGKRDSVASRGLGDVDKSQHSNWPTIPQFFVKGELVGGCDIVMEMESKGELKDILKKAV